MTKKKRKTMDQLAEGYREFIKGKELNDNGKDLFEQALKNTLPKPTKKPHGSK